ncbi:MAG: cytochrome c oxidase subunit 3 family protein [Minicystis sp.]
MSAHAPEAHGDGAREFHVAHHFDKADTQFDAGRMGVWLFLVTEILFFGGLFCAFAVFRSWYYDSFVEAHHHLDKVMGATNTVVLISSSFTMALGVRGAQQGKKSFTSVMLGLTLAFAATFLVIKYFEYSHKFHEGLLPGGLFHAEGFHSAHPGMFFAVYFMMTGIHGLHIVIGMGLILWILIRNNRGEFSGKYYAPVEGVGLYWHLVDLVWIYLFPLLYLIG